MQAFEGKVAVVTGAASGMGFAFAERFAQEGMKVVLADVEEPALGAAVQTLRHKEYDVLGVLTDVSSAESVEALARQTLEAYGGVHVVCNNAGVGDVRGAIWDVTLKDWQWVLGVNFWGVAHGIRAFVPLMLDQGEEGHIVNTASIAGLIPGWGVYGISKHAVVAMSESLSIQLRMVGAKIGVSVLCPSGVRTNISTSARNRPEELQNEDPSPAPTSELDPFVRYRDPRNRGSTTGVKQPHEVAETVFEAVRDDVFYILPHGEAQLDRVRPRFDDILQGRLPTPPISLTPEG